MAGLANLCCGKKDGMTSGTLFAGCCVSSGIAFLQLILTTCLIGWIWFCIWGIAFVGWSSKLTVNGVSL
jgi:hypothetical protein